MHDCAVRTTRGPLRITPTPFLEPSPRFCQLVARIARIFYCPSQKSLPIDVSRALCVYCDLGNFSISTIS